MLYKQRNIQGYKIYEQKSSIPIPYLISVIILYLRWFYALQRSKVVKTNEDVFRVVFFLSIISVFDKNWGSTSLQGRTGWPISNRTLPEVPKLDSTVLVPGDAAVLHGRQGVDRSRVGQLWLQTNQVPCLRIQHLKISINKGLLTCWRCRDICAFR